MTGKTALQEHIVPPHRIGNPKGFADFRPNGPVLLRLPVENHFLHSGFHLVRQLETIPGEEFDSVILIGVMRSRYDDPGIRPHTPGQEGYSRRRHWTDEQNIAAHRTDSGAQGGFQHVTRNPRILTDEDLVTVLLARTHHRGGAFSSGAIPRIRDRIV